MLPKSATIDLYDLSQTRLVALVVGWGFRPVHAARLWGYLYREGASRFEGMLELPAKLRAALAREAITTQLRIARQADSEDGFTRKYLLRLHDGQRIETVLMRFPGRVTACVSSQVGCALGCVFCATGQMGFTRNLSAGEIVAQALHVERLLREADDATKQAERRLPGGKRERLRNLVLMGMGEPLLNYEAVMTALEILRDPAGLAIGRKQITLSTVGVVPGIVRLADERQPYSLAVSLHAATQEERAAIVPTAKAWPLDALLEACRYYVAMLNRKIFFEWTLIDDQNDSPRQAELLGKLLRGMPAQVNLIPLNPTAGYAGQPGRSEALTRFQAILEQHGVPSTVRQRRGIDIAAGCGQLALV